MEFYTDIIFWAVLLISTIVFYNNQRLCPAGYFLDTSKTPADCSPCPEGKYTTESNIYWECHSCMLSCPRGTIEVHPCNSTSNLICKCRLKGQIFVQLLGGDGDGACFCKPGTFMKNDECVNHTVCPEGVKIIRNGTDYEDTVCDYVSSTTTLKTTTTTLETVTEATSTSADTTTRATTITTASESANCNTVITVLVSIIVILVIVNIGLCFVCLRQRQHRNSETGTAHELENVIDQNEISDV